MITATITFFIGLIIGILFHRNVVRRRLRAKAKNKTAESISSTDFVYIVDSAEYYETMRKLSCGTEVKNE